MQENKLKQRVVGGLVLLALAVIFIPMVLDFRKDYDQVINGTNIPPKPKEMRVETFELNQTPQAKVPRLAMDESSVEEKLANHPLVQQKRAADAIAAKALPPPPIKAAAAVKPVSVSLSREGWTVQVGSFSNEKNARGLRDKIRKNGFTAFVDSVNVKGKLSHRVRIGPAADKEKANTLKKRLQKEMSLKGLVIWHQR
ncbi:MAG: SPOR domain-containing protein [Gammaproteobacteria bacterium]|nr:SPOR domain-containing protein [Gammaproteobacteria bacterium]